MERESRDFDVKQSFEYEGKKKKIFAFSLIGIGVITLGIILLYVLSLQHIDFFLIKWINALVSHIATTINEATILGVLYSALFGGLFFVFLPLEILLARFFTQGHSAILIIVLYLTGLFLSFSLNYYVGRRLSSLSKKLISTKKFYGIKSKLNRYGAMTIFVFNALPLPSPPLSAILGVFNYNKMRFYTYFISAQLLKATVIALFMIYIY